MKNLVARLFLFILALLPYVPVLAQAANVQATVTFDPSLPAGEEYVVEGKDLTGTFVEISRGIKSPIIFTLSVTRPGTYSSDIRVKAFWKATATLPAVFSLPSNVASTTYTFVATAPVLKSVTSTIQPATP